MRQSILVGSDIDILYKLDVLTGIPEKENIHLTYAAMEPVVALYVNKQQHIVYGGTGVFLLSQQHRNVSRIKNISVKSFYSRKDELFVVSDRSVLQVDPLTLAIKDTIWNERATAVYATNDTFYIGTINGLYRCLPHRTTQFLGDRFAPF